MIKKVLLGFIIGIGSVVLLLVLALLGYGAYSVYANDKADKEAKLLCERIHKGSEISTFISTADAGKQKHRLVVYENKYRFIYYGAIFHTSECVVDTTNGKIVSAEMIVNDD
ncbi:MAG: hypothetical protein ABI644_13290 [Arenimonas sp.]